MSVWKSDETLLSICILNFSFKNDFVWEEISNIRHSVSSPDETLRLMFDILRETFEPRSHFISRLSIIIWVNVVLNRTIVDSGRCFNNLWGSHLQSKVLARRVSSCPMNAYFGRNMRKIYFISNYFMRKQACVLDRQFSMSGQKPSSKAFFRVKVSYIMSVDGM